VPEFPVSLLSKAD